MKNFAKKNFVEMAAENTDAPPGFFPFQMYHPRQIGVPSGWNVERAPTFEVFEGGIRKFISNHETMRAKVDELLVAFFSTIFEQTSLQQQLPLTPAAADFERMYASNVFEVGCPRISCIIFSCFRNWAGSRSQKEAL